MRPLLAIMASMLFACGAAEAPRKVTLKPFPRSERRPELTVKIDGRVIPADESRTFEYPDFAAARAARITVELVDANGPLSRAVIVPFEHCRRWFELDSVAHLDLDMEDVTHESMEVFLTDTERPPDGVSIDGPCLTCWIGDVPHGGCGGGAEGEALER